MKFTKKKQLELLAKKNSKRHHFQREKIPRESRLEIRVTKQNSNSFGSSISGANFANESKTFALVIVFWLADFRRGGRDFICKKKEEVLPLTIVQ